MLLNLWFGRTKPSGDTVTQVASIVDDGEAIELEKSYQKEVGIKFKSSISKGYQWSILYSLCFKESGDLQTKIN